MLVTEVCPTFCGTGLLPSALEGHGECPVAGCLERTEICSSMPELAVDIYFTAACFYGGCCEMSAEF